MVKMVQFSISDVNKNKVKVVYFYSCHFGMQSVLELHPAALGQSTRFCFLEVPLAIFFLPGTRVAVGSAHQPAELPRRLLTKP